MMLAVLARAPIGLGPFTSWKRDEITGLFLDLRWLAYGCIVAGLIVALLAFRWHRREESKR